MESLSNYLTAQEAAKRVGLKYPTFMARVRKNQIASVKKGWSVLIPESEVVRLEGTNAADSKNLERSTR